MLSGVHQLAQLHTGGSSDPVGFTLFNNELYFRAFTPSSGHELWKVNAVGTVTLVVDLPLKPDVDSVYPDGRVVRQRSRLWKRDQCVANGNCRAACDKMPQGDSNFRYYIEAIGSSQNPRTRYEDFGCLGPASIASTRSSGTWANADEIRTAIAITADSAVQYANLRSFILSRFWKLNTQENQPRSPPYSLIRENEWLECAVFYKFSSNSEFAA